MPHPPRLVTLATVTLSALTAAPALAEDGPPGMCECAAPAPAPVVVARRSGWDGRHLGVGLRATSMGLHAAETEDAEETHYGGGGLHVRYRFNHRWEAELLLEHLDEHDREGESTGVGMSSQTIGVRYHLTPYRRWDFYALVGIGGSQLMTDDGDEVGEPLGHFQLGGGVERRFGRFGVAAELRLVGMGPAEDEDTARMTVPEEEAASEDEGLSGGSFAIAGTYYF